MKKPPYEKKALEDGIEIAKENIARIRKALISSEDEVEKSAFREGIRREEARIAENKGYIDQHNQWEAANAAEGQEISKREAAEDG